tara:strand:+ start:850 stop:1491 length:642 start_codon:yes stop_codon:yes gene_type:complete
MPGNLYSRPMFRKGYNLGGMVEPTMAQGQMPEMAQGQMPEMIRELMEQAATAFGEATDETLMEQVEQGVGEEVLRSTNNMDMAGNMVDIMNSVWDDNRTIEDYRSDLAAIVGPEDASQTPESVLALVQPTLQLASIDEGIGALMREELSEIGAGGGITELATKSAVADGMAAETGALVNAVGGMSDAPQSMEDIMMAAVGEDMASMPTAPEIG